MVYLAVVLRMFLSQTNLSRVDVVGIYESSKVIIIVENNNLIFATR